MNKYQKAIASAAAKGGETVEAMISRYERVSPDYGKKLRLVWEGRLKPQKVEYSDVVLYEDPYEESYRRYRYRCYGYLVLEALLGLLIGLFLGRCF